MKGRQQKKTNYTKKKKHQYEQQRQTEREITEHFKSVSTTPPTKPTTSPPRVGPEIGVVFVVELSDARFPSRARFNLLRALFDLVHADDAEKREYMYQMIVYYAAPESVCVKPPEWPMSCKRATHVVLCWSQGVKTMEPETQHYAEQARASYAMFASRHFIQGLDCFLFYEVATPHVHLLQFNVAQTETLFAPLPNGCTAKHLAHPARHLLDFLECISVLKQRYLKPTAPTRYLMIDIEPLAETLKWMVLGGFSLRYNDLPTNIATEEERRRLYLRFRALADGDNDEETTDADVEALFDEAGLFEEYTNGTKSVRLYYRPVICACAEAYPPARLRCTACPRCSEIGYHLDTSECKKLCLCE